MVCVPCRGCAPPLPASGSAHLVLCPGPCLLAHWLCPLLAAASVVSPSFRFPCVFRSAFFRLHPLCRCRPPGPACSFPFHSCPPLPTESGRFHFAAAVSSAPFLPSFALHMVAHVALLPWCLPLRCSCCALGLVVLPSAPSYRPPPLSYRFSLCHPIPSPSPPRGGHVSPSLPCSPPPASPRSSPTSAPAICVFPPPRCVLSRLFSSPAGALFFGAARIESA